MWIPGLIANILYINEANNVERITGKSPEGKGCLVVQLVLFGILPLVGICLLAFLFVSLGVFSQF